MNNVFELNPALGQVWTPFELACSMVDESFRLFPKARRILDPACGPATFSRAINHIGFKKIHLTCYDIDARMQQETAFVNQKLGLRGKTILQDYLSDTSLENSFDIIIMNPPYIRQELISQKNKENYYNYLSKKLGEKVDKKSNLFALFLLKSIIDLTPDGILCAVVFDAITNSAYGKKTLSILHKHAELLSSQIIKTPFDNVIIDAQVLLYRKRKKPLLNLGETHELNNKNYISLGSLLDTRRGTALPKRKPYLASIDDIYYNYSKPFFIKQARLKDLLITSDQRIYLSDSNTEPNEAFQAWFNRRLEQFEIPLNKRLIKPIRGWIAFNYYIRNAPRHLWNTDNIPLSDNFYVSNPNSNFPADVAWLLLNSDEYLNRLVDSARNQGNGLRKLQLYEYKSVVVPNWNLLKEHEIDEISETAKKLIYSGANHEIVREAANKAVRKFIYE